MTVDGGTARERIVTLPRGANVTGASYVNDGGLIKTT
jgi:hypothetical protein